MSQSYDYSKVWVTEAEVQEMLEGIGAAIEAGDLSGLPRAREIGSQILSDVIGDDDTRG